MENHSPARSARNQEHLNSGGSGHWLVVAGFSVLCIPNILNKAVIFHEGLQGKTGLTDANLLVCCGLGRRDEGVLCEQARTGAEPVGTIAQQIELAADDVRGLLCSSTRPDEKAAVLRAGLTGVTPKRVLHSNVGCHLGTIQKSAIYKICGAAERRVVPIGELVENKPRRLKKKQTPTPSVFAQR